MSVVTPAGVVTDKGPGGARRSDIRAVDTRAAGGWWFGGLNISGVVRAAWR